MIVQGRHQLWLNILALSVVILFCCLSKEVSSLVTPDGSKCRTQSQPTFEISRRRGFVDLCSWTTAALCTAVSAPVAGAVSVPNPLNLKGSFWETGELYQKSDKELSIDPEELLGDLVRTAGNLNKVSEVAIDGKFGDLSRLLRGGAISESQIRLKANALIDQIDDDKQEYVAIGLFRVFLRDFDTLDRTVEAAARQTKLDGGAIETLGLAIVSPFGAANEVARISNEPSFGKDSRIQVLAALQETMKSLQAFNKAVGGAIKAI